MSAEKKVFSLAVHGAPDSPSLNSAVAFLIAATAAGNRIYRVFFYHEGVGVADQQDGPMLSELIDLSTQHGFELAICIGAATRRGVVTDQDPNPINPAFQVVGLGQLIDAILNSDRFVTFAA